MRILLDTHILIWYIEGIPKLSPDKRLYLDEIDNEIVISIASLWEIAIKISSRKLELSKPLADFVVEINSTTTVILPIDERHVVEVSTLPFQHRDPFDRIIIAQARVDGLKVMTHDGTFADYGVDLL